MAIYVNFNRNRKFWQNISCPSINEMVHLIHIYTVYFLIYICFDSFIRVDQYRLKKHGRSNVTNKSLPEIWTCISIEKKSRDWTNIVARVSDDLIFVTTDAEEERRTEREKMRYRWQEAEEGKGSCDVSQNILRRTRSLSRYALDIPRNIGMSIES